MAANLRRLADAIGAFDRYRPGTYFDAYELRRKVAGSKREKLRRDPGDAQPQGSSPPVTCARIPPTLVSNEVGSRSREMTDRLDNPWRIEHVEDDAVARLALRHVANSKAVELAVDIVGNPQREDDEGLNWARLSDARSIADVVPGSAVILGSSVGRYLAMVVAWDFEVDDDDPVASLELLPIRPSEVARLLGRKRATAS